MTCRYQRDGVLWLLRNCLTGIASGGILGDEMGLGKTCQACVALACCDRLKHPLCLTHSTAPSCVVMPKSLLLNWKCEVARFVPEERMRCVV